MCKSFFATLECELIDQRRFATRAAAQVQSIEGFRSPSRRHSSIGYMSPAEFEATHAQTVMTKPASHRRKRVNSTVIRR